MLKSITAAMEEQDAKNEMSAKENHQRMTRRASKRGKQASKRKKASEASKASVKQASTHSPVLAWLVASPDLPVNAAMAPESTPESASEASTMMRTCKCVMNA